MNEEEQSRNPITIQLSGYDKKRRPTCWDRRRPRLPALNACTWLRSDLARTPPVAQGYVSHIV